MRGYRPEELFDGSGRLLPELAALAPTGDRGEGLLLFSRSAVTHRRAAMAHQVLPTPEQQAARAEWALAWHLHRAGRREAADRHFRRAGELAPGDWTIRRGSLPIRGLDPMASEEFLALWQEGAPRYPSAPLPEVG